MEGGQEHFAFGARQCSGEGFNQILHYSTQQFSIDLIRLCDRILLLPLKGLEIGQPWGNT